MSTIWNLIATFALPTPLALLVLLNLPLPKPFKRGVLTFVARVFDLPIIGIAKALHFMLFVLAIAVGAAINHLHKLNTATPPLAPFATPNYEISTLSKRWRAERNLWLSAFAFTMWGVLAAFYREVSRRIALEERLAEFEMSDYTGTIDTTREVSTSKEVTSKAIISPRKSPTVSPVKAPRGVLNSAAGKPPRPAKAVPLSASPPAEVELVGADTGSGDGNTAATTNKFVKKDQ